MTSSLEFCERYIDRVFVTAAARETPGGREAAERAAAVWPGWVEGIAGRGDVPEGLRNRRSLVIDDVRGDPLSTCPGSRGQLRCNYHAVDLYIGCSIGCSYCIMNNYLNFAPLVVQANTAPIISAIREAAVARAPRPLRVGSGEVGDSLLVDPVFRLNEKIITGVADLPNVHYESKSKMAWVDHLLSVHPKGGAVMGFSLNPPEVTQLEEGMAADPRDRIKAARQCVAAGYRAAFHFDPIFRTASFPDDYLALIHELGALPPSSIAWIGLGTIRYPPAMRDAIIHRPFAREEFIPCPDGKMRYLQPVRREMYREMKDALEAATDAPVYMCMESPAMWRGVFGRSPERAPRLHGIFDLDSAEDAHETRGR